MSRKFPETHRKDSNHDELFDLTSRLPNVEVVDTHNTSGWGDMFAWFDARGLWFVFEIKSDPRDELTPREEKSKKRFGDHWRRVDTFDDILRAFDLLV